MASLDIFYENIKSHRTSLNISNCIDCQHSDGSRSHMETAQNVLTVLINVMTDQNVQIAPRNCIEKIIVTYQDTGCRDAPCKHIVMKVDKNRQQLTIYKRYTCINIKPVILKTCMPNRGIITTHINDQVFLTYEA